MIERNIPAYCMQETWKLGDYMLTVRGFTIFHHGMNDKPQRLGRVSAGVMIILGPALTQAWMQTGKLKPVTSPETSKFPVRILGVPLSFPNFANRREDAYNRKAKGSIT